MTPIKKKPANELVRQSTKADFLNALRGATFGNLSIACKAIGRSRQTMNEWRRVDPEFDGAVQEAVLDGKEQLADIAEHALKKKIDQGDTTAIIFTLKSLRRKDYGEFREYEASSPQKQGMMPFLAPKTPREAILQMKVIVQHYFSKAEQTGLLDKHQIITFQKFISTIKSE